MPNSFTKNKYKRVTIPDYKNQKASHQNKAVGFVKQTLIKKAYCRADNQIHMWIAAPFQPNYRCNLRRNEALHY